MKIIFFLTGVPIKKEETRVKPQRGCFRNFMNGLWKRASDSVRQLPKEIFFTA